jgi:hypothetical protein
VGIEEITTLVKEILKEIKEERVGVGVVEESINLEIRVFRGRVRITRKWCIFTTEITTVFTSFRQKIAKRMSFI